jgi:GntR family transcriptional regulator, arabinose operon transcriptional repressor
MGVARRLYQYEEIARELRLQILRGDFADGKLPSERALGERFRVQRNTIRQALGVLEKDGQISVSSKRGSFVKASRPETARHTFLIYLHRDASPDLSRLMDGFTETSHAAGYSVRRVNTNPPEGAGIDRIPKIEKLPQDAAGVVLWPQSPTDEEALSNLNKSIPLVLVDRRVLGIAADCVRFDDVQGGRMATEHLLHQGHRKIAFLADEVFVETVQNRWRGYVMALETAGVPMDVSHSLFFYGLATPIFALTIRHLLASKDHRPTAFVCSNDLVAFTLLRFLRDEGVRVPDDVAVTGYGNIMPDYLEAMALTSVDQSFNKMGQAAANILLERMRQTTDERLRDPRDITIPVQLVVRPKV